VKREFSCALLTIKDHGIGIPKEDLKNVFERFQRASNTKGITGTGLGLFISKIIIEKHKGQIEIDSEVNKGTIVQISLDIIK